METIFKVTFLLLLTLGVIAVDRVVDALNESNRIMVGVENGKPAGQNFHNADPAKTF